MLNRDGTDIVPKGVERYVDREALSFIQDKCTWKVFEGIHRVVVGLFVFEKNVVPLCTSGYYFSWHGACLVGVPFFRQHRR